MINSSGLYIWINSHFCKGKYLGFLTWDQSFLITLAQMLKWTELYSPKRGKSGIAAHAVCMRTLQIKPRTSAFQGNCTSNCNVTVKRWCDCRGFSCHLGNINHIENYCLNPTVIFHITLIQNRQADFLFYFYNCRKWVCVIVQPSFKCFRGRVDRSVLLYSLFCRVLGITFPRWRLLGTFLCFCADNKNLL